MDPGDGEVHYFGYDDLPTTARDVEGAKNTESGKGVNPANGFFVSINETPGQVTTSSTVGGFTKTVDIPYLPADSVTIGNIYFTPGEEFDENPTPEWCTE
jgi:hypothetical protein